MGKKKTKKTESKPKEGVRPRLFSLSSAVVLGLIALSVYGFPKPSKATLAPRGRSRATDNGEAQILYKLREHSKAYPLFIVVA